MKVTLRMGPIGLRQVAALDNFDGADSVPLILLHHEPLFLRIMADSLLQCAQMQGDWIVGLINRMNKAGERKVLVEKEHEDGWCQTIREVASMSLVPGTKSVCSAPTNLLNLTAWTTATYCINLT